MGPNSVNQDHILLEKLDELRIMNHYFCESEDIFELLNRLEEIELQSKSSHSALQSDITTGQSSTSKAKIGAPNSRETTDTRNENRGDSPHSKINFRNPTGAIEQALNIISAVESAKTSMRLVQENEKIPTNLQLGFEIERFRLDCWYNRVFSKEKLHSGANTTSNIRRRIYQDILSSITQLSLSIRSREASLPPKLPPGLREHPRTDILISICDGNNRLECLSDEL